VFFNITLFILENKIYSAETKIYSDSYDLIEKGCSSDENLNFIFRTFWRKKQLIKNKTFILNK